MVLLGPRATDGSNKRRRSQSRAKKFAVTELSESLISFVATVVCLSKCLANSNTDETKLYFLLDTSTTTFSEDADQFRNFFENRYVSLTNGRLSNDLPQILRQTMRWLNNGVFVQEGDAERAEIDEEQDAFEEEFERGIEEASSVFRSRRMQAIEELRREEEADGDQ